MAYGTIKVNNITFDDGGSDQTVTVSGLYNAFTNDIAVTGTISGTTVTGTTANFVSGVFTTQISGTTVTGTTSSFTTGNFTTLSGATATFTSGVIASGTATNPSLSFVGDLNTGIFSPGADQVAVATNGTGRLFVNASGNVGVGTASPGVPLDISTSGQTTIRALSSETSGVNIARFLAEYTGSGASFTQADLRVGGNYGLLGVVTNHPLLFTTNNTERLRISSAGLVGIGDSAPDALLTVNGVVSHGAGSASAPSIAARGDLNTGAFFPAADTFGISTGGSERFRCDSSGRLLVGTSTALNVGLLAAGFEGLQVASTTSAARASLSRWDASTADPSITLAKSRGGTVGINGIVVNGDNIGRLEFTADDGTTFNTAARILAQVDGTPGANDMPGRLVFSTTADGASSPTERMRISQNGGILVNTTSPDPIGSSASQSASFGPGASAGAFNYYNASATCMKLGRGNDGSLIDFFRNQPSATVVGSISVTTTATAYNTSSDYRLKENVVDLDGAIDRLKQLPVHRFNFIADPDTVVDGFIAHEAAEVVPECVTGTKDEVDEDGNPQYQGIDQSKLVPLLTAALQEAIGEIESLKARLDAANL